MHADDLKVTRWPEKPVLGVQNGTTTADLTPAHRGSKHQDLLVACLLVDMLLGYDVTRRMSTRSSWRTTVSTT